MPWNNCREILTLYKLLDTNENERKRINKDEGTSLDTIKSTIPTVVKKYKNLTIAWDKLKKSHTDVGVYDETKDSAISYQQEIAQLAQTAGTLGGHGKEETRQKRSKSMHDVAQSRSGSVGIWKVGEEHVPDMITEADRRNLYEILTKEQFNTEYIPENKKTT